MKFARQIGYPLSVTGLILYSPPMEKWLEFNYGNFGRFGGVVVFAIGWSLLLAYLAFNLGKEYQRKKIH